MNPCKFCSQSIHWINSNGKWLPFEDSSGSQLHKCVEWKNQKQSMQLQISELREQQQIDHHLIVKLISKIGNSDKRYEM